MRSVQGGFSTISGKIISFTLTIGSTAIMARLLTPRDYGLIAMVTAFTGFISLFKDLGLSSAVIQNEKINDQQVSTIFWINILVGLVLGLIILGLAPFLEMFYKEPALLYITSAYAVTAIISVIPVQHRALLTRQMKFKQLVKADITATILSVIIGIGLAYMGLGYWSIVGQYASNLVISIFLIWAICDWRPKAPKKNSNVNHMLRFGAAISGFNFVNYFSRNLDNILIGRYFGAGPLGLYSKAYQLLMLPISQLREPLNTVGVPALSTLQNDPKSYRSYYRKYLFILAFISMPVVSLLAVFSEEVISIILGSKWIASSDIFQILAITAFIQPVAGTRGLVLISMGHSRKYFSWGVVNSVFVISSFIIGIQFGVIGVCVAYGIVNYLILVPSLYYCFKDTPVTVKLFFSEITFPAVISMLMAIFLLIIKLNYLSSLPNLLSVIIATIAGFLAYLAMFSILPRGRSKLLEMKELILMITNRIK